MIDLVTGRLAGLQLCARLKCSHIARRQSHERYEENRGGFYCVCCFQSEGGNNQRHELTCNGAPYAR